MDSDPYHKNKIKFNKEKFIFITDLKVLIWTWFREGLSWIKK